MPSPTFIRTLAEVDALLSTIGIDGPFLRQRGRESRRHTKDTADRRAAARLLRSANLSIPDIAHALALRSHTSILPYLKGPPCTEV